MMSITNEQKQEIIKAYATKPGDTGSARYRLLSGQPGSTI